MRYKHYSTKALLATIMAIFLGAASAMAQCVIPIGPGQSYTEDFQSGEMECWTVETTGNATWAVMTGTGSNVVAFQNASAGEEARLVSPTFDLTGSNSATFSFAYVMMGFYPPFDELTVSYRTSPSDNWHQLATYSLSDWSNTYDASLSLDELSSTFQVSFLGHSNGGYYIFVDDIDIVSAGGCARPANLTVTEITSTSASLDWSVAGNEESWTIELNGQQITVATHPYLMDRLEPNTEYTFRVKANCGGGMDSEWSQPTTFKTLCDVITVTDDQPYFDDFEASEDFVCWQSQIISGEDNWVVDPGYLFPNNTAFFIWLGEEARLVSAPMDITAVTAPTLKYNYKLPQGEYAVDELSVWYRTSENDAWKLIEVYIYATDGWQLDEFPLPEPSATYQISFVGVSHGAEGVYVDDVMVGDVGVVGLGEQSSLAASVLPNPTQGKVIVEANVAEGEVAVFDLFGKEVFSTRLREGRAELDLSGVAKGVYVARITSATDSITIKLVKE